MEVNGTLINYYFHCRRQCYLFGNHLNLEDNSEEVHIGKVLHKLKEERYKEHEIEIDHIKIDGLTAKYLIEIKKSDADLEATRWQILLYLYVLQQKGVKRQGKIQIIENKKQEKKEIFIDLDESKEKELLRIIEDIKALLSQDIVPKAIKQPTCKKCAYYEYCYI